MEDKTIVVLNFITNTIGDSLYLLPVLHKLKQHYKRVYLTGSKITKEVIGEKVYDKFILLKNLEKIPSSNKLKKAIIITKVIRHTIKELRKLKPDVAIVLLPNFPPYQLIPFLAGIKERYGFSFKGSLDFLFTKTTIFRNPYTTKEIVHISESNMEIIRLMNIKINKTDLLLRRYVSNQEKNAIKNIIKNKKKPFFVFQPGAKYKNRQWPPERFAELGKKIIRRYGGSVFLIGSPEEVVLCNKIQSNIGKSCYNMAGKIKIRNIAALLEKCKVAVGNDSGIMHLAASVNCKTVVLFGSTNPRHSLPWGRNLSIAVKPREWKDNLIFKKESLEEPSKYLLSISVEDVFKAVKRAIDS